MPNRKTIILKINGSQDTAEVESLRRQLVSNLKKEYNIVFLPDTITLDDIDFRIVDEDPCCDEPVTIGDYKDYSNDSD